ncbi:MAG: adenine-specific DNA-methyltransferase [Actinomycetota bacterium]|nr:adenine-specific DNA-methyltransferase [Actinomycetota bacterium]
MDLLALAENRRRAVLDSLDSLKQAETGQFLTPVLVARTMAFLPALPSSGHLRVLDPGAGSGVLTAAILDRVCQEAPAVTVSLTVVEADATLLEPLAGALADCRRAGASTTLVHEDFVTWALGTDERFDLVIQNPPYRKLRSGSETDVMLRAAGVVVPNIYAAFMALGSRLLDHGGQQVSITPRSWMNGSYYSAFRRAFLHQVGIDSIHTFASRSKVFGDMGVLQEAIIVSSTVGAVPTSVRLCSSHGPNDGTQERRVPYEQVVTSDFVFVPASDHDAEAVAWMSCATSTLAELGLTVSTGRVVDFRSRDLLVHEAGRTRTPMVYPANIKDTEVLHPRDGVRKPQWFEADAFTCSKMLVPAGSYVLVKRFSTKEEKRRIVAAVWSGEQAPAFDNKVNYLHENGHGLDPVLARGLAVWLNSTQVDDYFRVFSGHTQVNATDLRQMKFPSREQLTRLADSEADSDLAVEHVVGRGLAVAV